MAIVSVIPWLVGFVGQVSGGFVSDLVYKKTGRLMLARIVVIVVCLFESAIGGILGGLANSATNAVILMSLTIFCQYVITSHYGTIIQDVARGKKVGGVGGFVHFLSNLAWTVGPAATEFIV